MNCINPEEAAHLLRQGKIVAYPTEAVFGLGCDPNQQSALEYLLALKARPAEKGLILIASHIAQIMPYLDLTTLSSLKWEAIQKTWPGPYTWVFPASAKVHPLVRGQYPTVAVRVTAHPAASQLCQAFGGAIVSTSANVASEAPFTTACQVYDFFTDKIAGILEGEVGALQAPTPIQDARTGAMYRV